MKRYAQEIQPQQPERNGKPNKDTVRAGVHDVLSAYLEDRQQVTLPEPMPPHIGDAVRWWIDTMQENQRWYEKPVTVGVIGSQNSVRWEYPYQMRVVNNLAQFLRLPVADRQMIVSAREDGVYWRGEPVSWLVDICNEHEKMKREGTAQYVKQARAKLNKLAAKKEREARRARNG